jgi:hypothetical protein
MNGRIGLVSLSLVALALPGCRTQDAKAPVAAAPTTTAPVPANPHAGMPLPAARKEAVVQLPDSVKAKWKAVKITVVDIPTKKETTYTVKLGSDFAISGTGLTLRVLAFVPDFTMDNGVITTKTETTTNPATQIRVMEGGQEVFKGWLFTKFPDIHPFEHTKVAIRMTGSVPE